MVYWLNVLGGLLQKMVSINILCSEARDNSLEEVDLASEKAWTFAYANISTMREEGI